MSRERAQLLTGLILLAVVTAFVAASGTLLPNDYYVKLVMLIGMNVILAVSLTLASGFTGVFSLGQIGFMAIGAYTSSLLTCPVTSSRARCCPGCPAGWPASISPRPWLALSPHSVWPPRPRKLSPRPSR